MAVPRSIKAIVQKTLNRNLETKISSVASSYTLYNSSIQAADLALILPPVQAGTGQNQRIGATIRPTKMVIRGYVNYATSNSALSDARMLGARLFVFKDKSLSGYASFPASGNNVNLIDYGGAGSTYTGTAASYIAPKNNDQFHFYADKHMKILKTWGLTNNFAPSVTNAMTSMNTTLFHPFTITLTSKQLPAVLHYDPSTGANYPSNFAPILALGYSDLLNSGPDTVTTQVGMEWVVTLYYKDA